MKKVAGSNGHGRHVRSWRGTVTRLELLIDADDTLWENNIYFEAAFDEFCRVPGPLVARRRRRSAPCSTRSKSPTKIHGYGSLNFGRNLQQCYQHLAEREIRAGDLETRDGLRRRGFWTARWK